MDGLFHYRLVSENVISSFKQLASENESIQEDKSSPDKRNYRSRSPLLRGNVSLEEAKPLIQEKVIETNMILLWNRFMLLVVTMNIISPNLRFVGFE